MDSAVDTSSNSRMKTQLHQTRLWMTFYGEVLPLVNTRYEGAYQGAMGYYNLGNRRQTVFTTDRSKSFADFKIENTNLRTFYQMNRFVRLGWDVSYTHTHTHTRWFKYDRDWFLCKQAAYVPVIFEPSFIYFFFLLAQQPPVGYGLLNHEVSRSHSTTHHSR